MKCNDMKKNTLTAAVINLGCKVNKYEADSMKDKLLMAGIRIVEPEEAADIYIVNTCSVTNMAQKKSRQMLRRAKKMNPEAVIVAAGCYVNAEHEILKKEDFIDIVVSNNCKKDIAQIIKDYITDCTADDYYVDINHTGEYEEMGNLDAAHLDHQRAYIKIQDGCNQFCSYCIIPYTRGRVRSRKPEHIIEEITRLAKEGVKEFVLTGIHISSYGIDFGGDSLQYDEFMEHAGEDMENRGQRMGLGQLVKAIAKIPEVKRIRLGSLEPRIITEEFLEILAGSRKVCPHFHLSLQSACNDTLKRMNRKYTIEEFMEKCGLIRKYFDKPAVTTDVIVGFPGETEEEFAVTMDNLEKLKLYEIHVFKYSVREGTPAQKMPDQVAEDIKTKRSERLLELTKKQKKEYEASLKGYVDEVLIEERIEDREKLQELKEVRLLESGNPSAEKEQMKEETLQYFTGHTKRYVKVKACSKDNIINQIVGVEML